MKKMVLKKCLGFLLFHLYLNCNPRPINNIIQSLGSLLRPNTLCPYSLHKIFYMLIGYIGVGKTQFTQKLWFGKYFIVSENKIHNALDEKKFFSNEAVGSIRFFARESAVHYIIEFLLIKASQQGTAIILDACNLSPAWRRKIFKLAKGYDIRITHVHNGDAGFLEQADARTREIYQEIQRGCLRELKWEEKKANAFARYYPSTGRLEVYKTPAKHRGGIFVGEITLKLL